MPFFVIRNSFNDPCFSAYLLNRTTDTTWQRGVCPDVVRSVLSTPITYSALLDSSVEYVEEKYAKQQLSPAFDAENDKVLKILQRRLEIPTALRRKVDSINAMNTGKKQISTCDVWLHSDATILCDTVTEYRAILEDYIEGNGTIETYVRFLADAYKSTLDAALATLERTRSTLLSIKVKL
jgi:hypothetical protein